MGVVVSIVIVRVKFVRGVCMGMFYVVVVFVVGVNFSGIVVCFDVWMMVLDGLGLEYFVVG